MKRPLRLEFYSDASVQWRWRLLSGNGKVLGASTESFERRTGARRNAARNYAEAIRAGRIVLPEGDREKVLDQCDRLGL